MEYTVNRLAKLAGVSTRTLRYYDQIGLLKPGKVRSNGYRIYEEQQVDMLQQILFFKELGFELDSIRRLLQSDEFDYLDALKTHLHALQSKKEQLDMLIDTVTKTIQKEEGLITMSDQEKFEGFKKQLVDENEAKYGEEIRAKYGEETVEASNARMMNMTQQEYEQMQGISAQLMASLEKAVQEGQDPTGEIGREVAQMHKSWLGYTWGEYNPQAHKGLAQMYLDDARFTAYYDEQTPGCAQFLRDAIHQWVDELA
ncbi:MerR family transcriptional regulator [Eubacteriales bacterium OttesenSCG-928-N14]|nr:MerR family transcriptional regulator [Eubacteriales bacterium OttesenSCG-928-N14]